MCGIAGIVSLKGESVDPNQVTKMLQKIKHRGPDDEGLFLADMLCFGHVRLSIIDLSVAAHQPMVSWDKRYSIAFNGEIYNYLELKKQLQVHYPFSTASDTEVLLAAYIVWGEKCLHRLNGDFSFVIYDAAEQILFGARDRFGIKPFYYYQNEASFIFSSEIKGILPVIERPQANSKSIFEYLVYNRTDQSEETFFSGILKLQHGHQITIKRNQVQIRKWYNLSDHLSYPTVTTPLEYREEISKSLQLRLRSDVPVGISLSGGIDSSSLTSILCNDLEQNSMKTFSSVFEKGSDMDESEFIEKFRTQVAEMHFAYPNASSFFEEFEEFISSMTEPIPGVSPYAQYKVMQLAKGKVVVTMDGQGADEMLGGYKYFFGSYFKELLTNMQLVSLVRESKGYLKKHSSMTAFGYFGYYLLPAGLKKYTSKKTFGNVSSAFYDQHFRTSTLTEDLYNPESLHDFFLQHFEYKLEHLLKWGDLNSMHFSIESRIPFLDHHLVEKTLSMPASQIIRGGVSKYILREAVKDVLPPSIYNRHDKKGYGVPADEWFRTKDFKNYIEAMLNCPRFAQRGYFDIKQCKEKYAAHLSGAADWSKEIWKWINLEVWFRQFIDPS